MLGARYGKEPEATGVKFSLFSLFLVGQSVSFNGASSIDNFGVAGYLWDFGYGETGPGVSPA